ncbi:hypothetical protein BaGK_01730 [Bacillus atrophaeus]|nr:hypothetical protein BaGK_01730 [Bacillus atrophaeus]
MQLYSLVRSSFIIILQRTYRCCFYIVKYFTFILCNISQTFAREKFCLIYDKKKPKSQMMISSLRSFI